MRYVDVPREVSFHTIVGNGCCLAPSKYAWFYPKDGVVFTTLDKVVVPNEAKRAKMNKRDKYLYYEIGDINVESGYIDGNEYFGYFLPSDTALQVFKDDILISTVRTYRKGVGIVADESKNIVCSPACLVIRSIEKPFTKEYLLAILRSDFFVEQILAFQTKGVYPRLDKEAMQNILIPVPGEIIVQYISFLQRAIIEKEKQIRSNHLKIHQIIENELECNQKPNKFEYQHPTIENLRQGGRIDAGFYCEQLKRLTYKTLNYARGYKPLTEQGLKLIPGPSLEIKLLGTRIDSDRYLPGFYRLITPKQISNYGTATYYEYIGTPRKISPIHYGDILFGESGTGRTMMYLEEGVDTINNAHAHILRPIGGECSVEKAISIRSILQYYKEIGVTDFLTVGGSGGHLSPSYFDRVYIPEFPEEIQKEIALLYHNPKVVHDVSGLTLSNFFEKDQAFNEVAGITELDRTAKRIKARLDEVLDQIIKDEPVEITFDFLKP